MFPQTELDNYKLQVELLQEKLQRSEISRQQLEHKLEKLLLKREEHEKIYRIKSKQKYQQFLEEQQRRNERNKQLVQMLEHIEQQTSAMNARSERLKMMKLQYEMYFAKLVHSQTRRCLQSSAAGTTFLHQSVGQTMTLPGVAPGDTLIYSNSNVYGEQQPYLGNTYQNYTDNGLTRDPPLLGSHREPTIAETPLSDYTLNSERSDYFETRRPDPYHQQRQPRFNANVNMRNESNPQINDSYQQRQPRFNANVNIRDESSSQIDDIRPVTREPLKFYKKQDFLPPKTVLSENNNTFNMDMPTTVSSSSEVGFLSDRTQRSENSFHKGSSNLEESLNATAIPVGNGIHDLHVKEITRDAINLEPTKNLTNSNPRISEQSSNSLPTNRPIYDNKESNNSNIYKTKPDEEVKYNSETNKEVEMKLEPKDSTHEITQEIDKKFSNLTTNEITSAETVTAPPVSIENIESAIYGELVSPLDQMQQNHEIPSKAFQPELLENLITQPPVVISGDNNITVTSIPETSENPEQQFIPEAIAPSYDTEIPTNNSQLSVEKESYDQTFGYDTSNTNLYPQQEGQIISEEAQDTQNATGYDVNTKILENDQEQQLQQQQQQEFDYTNYDPSQYSYPGYIYDETTGEYKPDPNAPAEQYATDQQYAQAYDQQYQQEGYDYNQAYEQPNQQTNDTSQVSYDNYDPTPTQMEQPSSAITEQSEHEQEVLKEESLQSEQPTPEPEQQLETTEPQNLTDVSENLNKNAKPTSILSTAEKNDQQKKKKRVNFVDSSETDSSSVDKTATQGGVTKPPSAGNESDFDFSSGSEAGAKAS